MIGKSDTNADNLFVAKAILSYTHYKKLKDEYRSSSYKLHIPAREGAAEFLSMIEKMYDILIITARPFDEYEELRQITTSWLKNNNLKYESLINSKKKHADIFSTFSKLEFMIEDNRYIANNIAKVVPKVFLFSNKYNEGTTNLNVIRISSFDEILANILNRKEDAT
jgi:uncharacterized HAD superfamily protein